MSSAPLRQTRLRVELVGPAGAGKSTLVGSLVARFGLRTGEIWGQPVVPLLLNGIQLVPTFGRLWLRSGSLLWDETRHMVRLRTLSRALRQPDSSRRDLLILDEGPVFALAWLRGFGNDVLREEISSEWWDAVLREWASLMDVVVVLDAPDAMLAQRIRARGIDHQVKYFPDDEIVRWMARFREALEWVLAGLNRHGGPSVVRLSSADATPDQIADRLTTELSGMAYAG